MKRRFNSIIRAALVLIVVVLVASSCGATTSDSSAVGFPDATVTDLSDGQDINFLETFADGETPVLLWFYFPH